MAKLTDIIRKAKAGKLDHVVFSFSSRHPGAGPVNDEGESDHVDEAFACYDIAQKGADWDRDTVIVDDELHALLSGHPENVLVEVFLDTCHSGTGLKDLPRPEGAVPAAADASRGPAARREVRRRAYRSW